MGKHNSNKSSSNNGSKKYRGGSTNYDNTDTSIGINSMTPSSLSEPELTNNSSDTNGETMSNNLADYMSVKNLAIIILVGLLVLSFLGINILMIFGRIIQFFTALIGPFFSRILSIFGYTTGTIINGTADIVSGTAKTGVDILDGTAHSVGNLFRGASNVNGNLPIQQELDGEMLMANPVILEQPTLPQPIQPEMPMLVEPQPIEQQPIQLPDFDTALNTPPATYAPTNPISDDVSSLIQSAISSNKASWCLVGEYEGRRGCVTVKDQSKCMSGQLYGSQQDCLNLQPDNGQNTNTNPTNNISSGQLAPPYANGTMNWGLPPPPPPQFYGVPMRMPQQIPPQYPQNIGPPMRPMPPLPPNMRGMPPPPPPLMTN